MSENQNTSPDRTPAGGHVDPDALMGRINGLSFLAVLIVSLLVHAALIGATSTTFIQQCIEYNTLEPDLIISENVKKEQAAERDKKRAERQAAEAAAVAKQKDKGGKATTKPATKIERKINEKSTTLPKTSGVNLDDIDEL